MYHMIEAYGILTRQLILIDMSWVWNILIIVYFAFLSIFIHFSLSVISHRKHAMHVCVPDVRWKQVEKHILCLVI